MPRLGAYIVAVALAVTMTWRRGRAHEARTHQSHRSTDDQAKLDYRKNDLLIEDKETYTQELLQDDLQLAEVAIPRPILLNLEEDVTFKQIIEDAARITDCDAAIAQEQANVADQRAVLDHVIAHQKALDSWHRNHRVTFTAREAAKKYAKLFPKNT